MPTTTNVLERATVTKNSDASKRSPSTVDRRAIEAQEIAASKPDRTIDFRTVNLLIGSKSRTAHTALRLAARGKITAIRLSAKTVRYSERSVLAYLASLGFQVDDAHQESDDRQASHQL